MGGVNDKGGCFDEDDWNTSSQLSSDNGLDWYRLSKKLAEERAWEMANEFGFRLSTINPSFIIGPPRTSRTDSTSLANMAALLEGHAPLRGATPVVDVRDVAAAHILATKAEYVGRRSVVTQIFLSLLYLVLRGFLRSSH